MKNISLCEECSNQVNIEAIYEKDKTVHKLCKCIYNFEIGTGNGYAQTCSFIIKTCSFFKKNIDKKLLSLNKEQDDEISSEDQKKYSEQVEILEVKKGSWSNSLSKQGIFRKSRVGRRKG